jgi:phasin family protein
MFSNTEQFSSATKTLFESQLAVFNQLTNKTIEGLQKVVALNIDAVKTSTEESLAIAKKMSDVKTPQALLDLTTQQARSSAEKAATYSRHFAEIATGLQAEFNKAAESQLQETKKKVEALIDDVTKHAPKGSESAVAMLKTAIHTANSGLEQITDATKQAVKTVEHQVVEATEQFAKAIEKSIPSAKTAKK